MLLTQLLSASPLAVPQLTSTSTTSTTTTTTVTSSAGRSNSNSNHPHQQQPQLIRKITNWSEKPPDTTNTIVTPSPPSDFGPPMQKQTKDLLIPLKSHFESFIKRNKSSSSRSVISRRSRNLQTSSSNNNNTDNNLNVYFEKSFVAINDTTNESNVDSVDSSEQSYSNPIRLHSDTGSAYFNDASILEAKKYNALLQHYKNDKSTTNRQRNHEFSHEMYQILSTTNNQQTQTELNQKLSHDFSIKLVVWIAAVIAISLLGLVVGVLFGGPTTCLNQQSAGAAPRTTAATTTTRTTANGAGGAGGGAADPIKGVSKAATPKTTDGEHGSSRQRAFELINTDKYTTFDIHTQQEQESGSQDKRNSTCKPDHTVPMLSVQTPGCAGMERLGVPTRTTITSSTTRDERSRRRRDTGNNETSSTSTLSSSSSSSSSITTKSNQYNHHPYSSSGMTPQTGLLSQICPNSNTKSLENQYPHHVQLPDGEYGDDRHLQIRTSSQQSEIPRTYTRPPPNRSVHDVPGQLNYRRTSNSVTNIHEHFGSGRSIATSSNSTPVSKLEKSKHNSKIFSFNFFKSNSSGITRSPNNNNNNNNVGSSLLPNVTTTAPSSTTTTASSSTTTTSATYSNNPRLEGASSHLLNLTSLPVPHHLVRNPSDHLTVNNYPSISSTNSSQHHPHHHHHHHNKPISCPTSPSSPIEQAASIDDAEEDDARLTNNARSASSSDNTCILSSSLESPKSSMYM